MSNDQELRASLDRTLRQEAALLALSAVGDQPFDARLRQILLVDAETMEVARVSFWSLREAPGAIECEELYLASHRRFERGIVLTEDRYPRYFEALRTGRPVVATDAQRDPATGEFTVGYLQPNGIGAMLDAPVYVRGQLAGVVCHEHVGGVRMWTTDEQLFAMSVAQQVALAIEAERRAEAESALRASEALVRTIFDAAPMPMLVSSYPDGVCLAANQAASRLTGVPLESLVGAVVPDLYADPEDRAALLVEAEAEAEGEVTGREVRLRRPDGTTFWALVSLRRLELADRPAVVAGFWDMTSQKELEARLRHMALHDPLTGLPNRAYFFDVLHRELERGQRDPQQQCAILFIDLDGFKEINDTAGHAAGDALLVETAARLRRCMRATDTAARIGGDEFTVLLVGLRDAAEPRQIAERISAVLAEPFRTGDEVLRPRASVGVAVSDGPDGDELLRRADADMYRAKSRSRRATS
jgi:diguanylate cyclase (GGDEF)-like protein/PAS domain S-box-containing protein